MAGQKRLIVGFDLGGTKMIAGLVNEKFEVLARERCKTRAKDETGGGDTYARIVELIRKLLAASGKTPAEIAGIGVGSPGPLNPHTGVIGDTPNLGWNGFPLRERLEKDFGVPVSVANDVDMGTYGEFHFGAAKEGRTVLGIFPGTGIGGGLVIEGRIHFGASGAAAEVGHLVLDPSGPRCGCGRRGCLEAYASRLAIAARAWILVARGDAPALEAEAGRNPRKFRSGAIAAAIAAGDKLLEEVVRDAAARIGQVAGGLVNVLSPDTIVLGGGLVEAMPDIFVGEVKEGVKRFALPEIGGCVKVKAAALDDDAVLLGAAKLLAERLGE